MTVASEFCGPTDLRWTGAETSFPAGFSADAAETVKVSYRPDATAVRIDLVQGIHFNVTGAGTGEGPVTVIPLAMPPAPGDVRILRDTPALQEVEFRNLRKFDNGIHTRLHDLSAMRDAELKMRLGAAYDALENAQHLQDLADHVDIVGADVDEAKTAAEAARDVAVAAAGSNLVNFQTRAAFALATVPSMISYAVLAGRNAAGDAPSALYKRLGAAPVPSRPWHVSNNGGADWWELVADTSDPRLFGVAAIALDNTTAVQAAVDYAAEKNVPMQLTQMYRCDSDVTMTAPGKSVVIDGNGLGSGFDFSQGNGRLTITGSATRIQDLTSNIAAGDAQADLTSAPAGLAPGSIIAVWNPTGGSWLSARSSYNAGEFLRVYKVVSNTVYFYGRAIDSYNKANVQVWRIDPVQAKLSNFAVKESGTKPVGCRVTYGVDVVADQVGALSIVSTAVEFDRCFGVQVRAPRAMNNSPYEGDEYAVCFANCQNFQMFGNSGGATRHNVAIGGYDGPLNIINRFGHIAHATLMNFNGMSMSADMHGNIEFLTYDDCDMLSGAGVGGANNTYRGCRMWSIKDNSSGYVVYGSEIRGGLFRFIDCEFYTGNGDLNAYGAIHFVVNYNNMQVEPLTLDVINPVFRGAGSANASPVQVHAVNGSNLKKVNIRIINPQCLLDQMSAVLFARNLSSPTALPSDYLIVDGDVVYTGSGRPYFIYPDASIAAVPRREMRQAGYADGTTTASTVLAPAASNFRFRYSKPPVVTPGVSRANGDVLSLVGTVAPVATIYTFDATHARPCVVSSKSDTNFEAGHTLRLHWSAEVRDV